MLVSYRLVREREVIMAKMHKQDKFKKYKIYVPDIYRSAYCLTHMLIRKKAFELSGKDQHNLDTKYISFVDGKIKNLVTNSDFINAPYTRINWRDFLKLTKDDVLVKPEITNITLRSGGSRSGSIANHKIIVYDEVDNLNEFAKKHIEPLSISEWAVSKGYDPKAMTLDQVKEYRGWFTFGEINPQEPPHFAPLTLGQWFEDNKFMTNRSIHHSHIMDAFLYSGVDWGVPFHESKNYKESIKMTKEVKIKSTMYKVGQKVLDAVHVNKVIDVKEVSNYRTDTEAEAVFKYMKDHKELKDTNNLVITIIPETWYELD